MLRSLRRAALLALVIAAGSLPAAIAASARQEASPMHVDLIVPATGYTDLPGGAETVCVMLPDDTTAVTVSRRALVADAGVDRPLVMTIRPFASTAHALAEMPIAESPSTLVTSGLGGPMCFSFENPVSARAADGAAQAYLYFAQVVTLQSR